MMKEDNEETTKGHLMTETTEAQKFFAFLEKLAAERSADESHPANSLDAVESHQIVSLAYALSSAPGIVLYDELFEKNDVQDILEAVPYGTSAYLTFQNHNNFENFGYSKPISLAITSTSYKNFSATSRAVFDALDRDVFAYFKAISIFNYFNNYSSEDLDKAGFSSRGSMPVASVMFSELAPQAAAVADTVDEMTAIRSIIGIPFEHTPEIELNEKAGTFLSNGSLFIPDNEKNPRFVSLAQVWYNTHNSTGDFGLRSIKESKEERTKVSGRSISLMLHPPAFESYMIEHPNSNNSLFSVFL